MTPELCLISVPHNGTNFVREIFVSQGWNDITLVGRKTGPTMYQGHCEKLTQTLAAIELSHRMPVIMPLRHPYRVEESWRRRNEDTDRMLSAYAHMLDYLRPCVTVWVPIDGDNQVRQFARQRLNEAAGKTLSIVWDRPVNSLHGTHALDISTLDPSERMRDIRRHPLFIEFYGTEECDVKTTVKTCA